MGQDSGKFKESMSFEIRQGDALEVLKTLPSESVHCCVTSPPYWGLRDYGVSGQLGLEKTPELYVSRMTEVFREVRRVLRSDGTLWLNIGDSYSSGGHGGGGSFMEMRGGNGSLEQGAWSHRKDAKGWCNPPPGLKPKDLCGIPWLLAFALRSDGWYLRQDIIWSKPNPMPESVTDRCTKAHEYLFLLSKSSRYYYDCEAIKELALDPEDDARRITQATLDGKSTPDTERNGIRRHIPGNKSHKGATAYENGAEEHRTKAGLVDYADKVRKSIKVPGGWDRGAGAHGTIHRNGRTSAEYQEAEVSPYRNRRSVWEIATSPFPEAHFATFPPKLIEPCILAGCPEGGTVLDPFAGAGTTGLVATRLQRNAILIELNSTYCEMMRNRIVQDAPLFHAGAYALESGPAEGGTGPVALTDGQEKA